MLTSEEKIKCCNAIKTLFGNSFYVSPDMITEEAQELTTKALIELYVKMAPLNLPAQISEPLFEIVHSFVMNIKLSNEQSTLLYLLTTKDEGKILMENIEDSLKNEVIKLLSICLDYFLTKNMLPKLSVVNIHFIILFLAQTAEILTKYANSNRVARASLVKVQAITVQQFKQQFQEEV